MSNTYFTSRLRRSYLIVLASIFLAVACLWAAFVLVPNLYDSQSEKPLSDSAKNLIGIILAAAALIAAVLIEPLKSAVQGAVTDIANSFRTPACRIFVFGPSGAGKTTLIRRVIALMQDHEEKRTEDFSVYQMMAPLDLTTKRAIKVLFADYRGEDPSQVLVDYPTTFFGHPGHRLVNVILFMADIFPAYEENGGKALKNEEIVAKFGSDVRAKIEKRLLDTRKYISEITLNLIFALVDRGEQLTAVRVAINKVDLLEDFIRGGFLGSKNQCPHIMAKELYKPLIQDVERACGAVNVRDRFDVATISSRTREGVDELISKVFQLYDRDFSRR
jgi:GTPase SAR1 family protein